jgi:hypothetical protein
MVNHLEGIMVSLYEFFSNSLKNGLLELVKPGEIMETRWLQDLEQSQTCWISMLN